MKIQKTLSSYNPPTYSNGRAATGSASDYKKTPQEIAQELVNKMTANELTELIIHIEKLSK